MTNRSKSLVEQLEAYLMDEFGDDTLMPVGEAINIARKHEAEQQEKLSKVREAAIELYNSVATERSTYLDTQGNYAHLWAMDKMEQALTLLDTMIRE